MTPLQIAVAALEEIGRKDNGWPGTRALEALAAIRAAPVEGDVATAWRDGVEAGYQAVDADDLSDLLARGIPAAPVETDERRFPCAKCGALRSKAEGGTVFTVCDECWESKPAPVETLPKEEPRPKDGAAVLSVAPQTVTAAFVAEPAQVETLADDEDLRRIVRRKYKLLLRGEPRRIPDSITLTNSILLAIDAYRAGKR